MYEDKPIDRSVMVVACKGRVHGLDRRNGHKLWEVVITEQVDKYHGGLAVDLLITAERVYAASWMSDAIVCIDYPSGKEIGRASIGLEGEGRPSMMIDADQLFVSRDGQVACLTLDGKPIWKNMLRGVDVQAPTAMGFPENVRQGDDRYRR